jgi:hypothetical protein
MVGSVPEITWELFHYTDESPILCYKPEYLKNAWSQYEEPTRAIRDWLCGVENNPDSLMSEDKSDYCGHAKITEPKYNINVYARWDKADAYVEISEKEL